MEDAKPRKGRERRDAVLPEYNGELGGQVTAGEALALYRQHYEGQASGKSGFPRLRPSARR